MSDNLNTYIVCWYNTLYQVSSASQLVVTAIRVDTGSYNRFDLIQSLIPTRYLCNGYVPPGCFKEKLRNNRDIRSAPNLGLVNIKTQR